MLIRKNQTVFFRAIYSDGREIHIEVVKHIVKQITDLLPPNAVPITLLQALLPAPFSTKPLLHRHYAEEFN